jgi:hypothetical protein
MKRTMLELEVTSPAFTGEVVFQATGVVRFHDEQSGNSSSSAIYKLEGVSVRIRSLETGLVEEVFVDAHGTFSQQVMLEAEHDNTLEWTVWDGGGLECLRIITLVQHRSAGQSLGIEEQSVPHPLKPKSLQRARRELLDPPWPRFARLVQQCLHLAAELAQRTGRDREVLFQQVHVQDRYGEQAFQDQNQALYRECWDNLAEYAGYLTQLLQDSLPRPAPLPARSPEDEARAELDHFRRLLSHVWKQVRGAGRIDLEPRLAELARSAAGFTARLKTEPIVVLRDARRLCVEIDKIRARLDQPPSETPPDASGLLEGSS